MKAQNQIQNKPSWIYSPLSDGLFILLPAFFATAMVLIFPEFFQGKGVVSPFLWLLLVVGIDVAHVYSTLWRTYFDPEEFSKYRRLLIFLPLLAWLGGIGLYLIDGMVFWRVVAYLAVYHFIRQQYGFFRIYSRNDKGNPWSRRLDAAVIYMATLYPLIWWHTHQPRAFSWFIEGDFLPINAPWLSDLALGIYATVLLLYVLKEGRLTLQRGSLNLGKNLILLGTILSWYCGIVLINGDLAFTATNVVAHGIPYIALVWMYGRKKADKSTKEGEFQASWLTKVFQLKYLPVFIGVLLAIAYFEEGLWDALVWRDHIGLFPWAAALPFVSHELALAFIVPLLAMPQITHYLIDGFIWKVKKEGADLRRVVFEGKG